MTRNHIGVDLSKDVLDICNPRRGESRVPNQPAAVARWLAGLGAEDMVVYQSEPDRKSIQWIDFPANAAATGLRLAPSEAGRDGVRLNPLYAWHFARSLNLPQTDRVAQPARLRRDAAMLARLGAERQPAPDALPDIAREELRALVQRRDQL